MPHTHLKKKKKSKQQTMCPKMLYLVDRPINSAIINMFKDLKETRNKKTKGKYDNYVSVNRIYE